MAPYVSNYAPRVRIQYLTDGRRHTATLRCADTSDLQVNATNVVTNWSNLVVALLSVFEDPGDKCSFSVRNADYAQKDSDLFIPLDSSGAASQVATGSPSPGDRATLLTLVGRTAAGGAWRMSILGSRAGFGETSETDDWRATIAEAPGLDIIWDEYFRAGGTYLLTGGLLRGADNSDVVVVQPYVNVSYSRRSINRARR